MADNLPTIAPNENPDTGKARTFLDRINPHVEWKWSATDSLFQLGAWIVIGILGTLGGAPWILWVPLAGVLGIAIVHLRHRKSIESEGDAIRRMRGFVVICILAILAELGGVIWWWYSASDPKRLTELREGVKRRTEDRDEAIEARRVAERMLETERLNWEEERGELANRSTELQSALSVATSERDDVQAALDTRGLIAAKSEQCSVWLGKMKALRLRIENSKQISEEEWKGFSREFVEFAITNFTPAENALIRSDAGINPPFEVDRVHWTTRRVV